MQNSKADLYDVMSQVIKHGVNLTDLTERNDTLTELFIIKHKIYNH